MLFDRTSQHDYEQALGVLSQYLERFHGAKTVILIDEYDTPLQTGFINSYYPEVLGFMRIFLSAGLKDNVHLKKGVLTGILRVAKESIFTGINNLGVFTLLNKKLSDKFGITESEVQSLLRACKVSENSAKVQQWYNGYVFGETAIFNPWSILNYVDNCDDGCVPYWVNTSSNDLIKDFLRKSSSDVKQDLESLVQGKTIRKEIRADIVFSELEKSNSLLWSFLLFGGYLKVVQQEQKNEGLYCELAIPNQELFYLYKTLILQWFEENLSNTEIKMLLKSLLAGDIKTFSKIFQEFVLNSMSFLILG